MGRSAQGQAVGACLAILSLPLLYAQSLPFEPTHETGASVTGAFEGWFQNPDGSNSLLFGYYNRNQKQELDIPVGPGNRIDPGGPDRGQPTHFLTGRQWGMFVVKVRSDFGANKLTWTIVANGQTTVIPASLKQEYEISPLIEAAVGNTPPVLRFLEKGPSVQGPLGLTMERTAKVADPLALTAWISDDAKITTPSGAKPRLPGTPVVVRWTKYRGPGTVVFSKDRPEPEKVSGTAMFNGKATTTATFSDPGEYVLHILLTDYSGEGGGGFQCCWTTGQVKVSVQP